MGHGVSQLVNDLQLFFGLYLYPSYKTVRLILWPIWVRVWKTWSFFRAISCQESTLQRCFGRAGKVEEIRFLPQETDS